VRTSERLTPERARYWVGQQRRWMAERGDTLGGYLAFYAGGPYDRAEIAAIHAADADHLRRLERQLAAGGPLRW
jgi:hypothetical protein